ncbi:hypothetical protein FKV24_003205 [Lysobacter maris]|uniref:Uncharacterized protein n=1 Tax=Marilutibacter maris TaxID=1605891 RepID=A0A508AZF6_9GAMM|nr:hypothetical protein [Lysobacter maris]KAB8198222.1 hypothetical protein FKV24_003205 [Lysobacter maris]
MTRNLSASWNAAHNHGQCPQARRLLRAAAALALAALLAACGKSAEERITETAISAASGQKVEVERDGDQMTFKTGDGEMRVASGESLRLPDDFPDDVYLPGDYQVRSVLEVSGTRVLSLSAEGKAMDLFAEAREAMQASGWKQTMAMQHDADNAMLAFEKDARNAVVSINGDADGQVQIGLQLRERQ